MSTEDDPEAIKREQIKQLKLTSGQSIVGYVRCYVDELNSFVIDWPLAVEKYMDEDGNLRLHLSPWLEMVKPDASILMPYGQIITACSVTESSVEFYLERCRWFKGGNRGGLEDWVPDEGAQAN